MILKAAFDTMQEFHSARMFLQDHIKSLDSQATFGAGYDDPDIEKIHTGNKRRISLIRNYLRFVLGQLAIRAANGLIKLEDRSDSPETYKQIKWLRESLDCFLPSSQAPQANSDAP